MSIQVDGESRTISLSVGDLVSEILGGGSLNLSPLSGTRMEMGRQAHEAHQSTAIAGHPGYRAEQAFQHTLLLRDYRVTIQGRMDGVYREGDTWVIEEVKSILNWDDTRLPESAPASYILQIRLYLHFWMCQQETDKVIGKLILVGLDNSQPRELTVTVDRDEIGALIETAIGSLIDRHEAEQSQQVRKQALAQQLSFPFPQMRKHQDQMIDAIEEALAAQENLLVLAPTGVGKTVAALYATLKFAVQNGLRVFFLTSKTTQQKIVSDTLRLWMGATPADEMGSSAESPFSSLILQSKEKSCVNDVIFCHELRCPYARDFYTKINESNLLVKLQSVPLLTPELLHAQALEHEVCPFELSLEILPQVDLTICDYNYIYDPQISLTRILEEDCSRIIVIVDEAHNLYARAREYFSPKLELNRARQLKRGIDHLLRTKAEPEPLPFLEAELQPFNGLGGASAAFLKELQTFLIGLEEHYEETASAHPESEEGQQVVTQFDKTFFLGLREDLDELLRCYLVHRRKTTSALEDEAGLLDFFYQFLDFCRILEMEGEEFVHILNRSKSGPEFQILCLDPANQLKTRHREFYAVVGMSATLFPMPFYRDVLGFERETRLLSLPSPFPAENRKILVVPEVSTTYRDRAKNFQKVARIISDVVVLRPGNYFAFFPSFEFLREVSQYLAPPGYRMLVQQRTMPDHARQALLDQLTAPQSSNLVLAVQGGIFAEGVDYPGEMAVGAIIVGPGLPKVSFEQELMRQYYEEYYSSGFEYAYLYPGMSRVIQSAGRVIRSETDRGIILLLDKRFTHENYASLLPRDWYFSSPSELVSDDYLADLVRFWDGGTPAGQN